jgi:cell division transport system permease protein
MKVWLGHHLIALRAAVGRLFAGPVNTLLAVTAIGVALALPAGGQLLLNNAKQMASHSTPTPQLSVYLSLEAAQGAASTLRKTMEQHSGVASAKLVSRDETLQRMRQSSGLKEVIDALPANPFPDALVIIPKDERAEAMEALATEFKALPNVDHVQLDSAWAKRLDALLKLGRTSVTLLSVLLGTGLIAITFNVIRLQVMTMRAEIEVSQLLGATDSYIRRPFLYSGSLLGLLGGVLACGIVFAAQLFLSGPVSEISELYGFQLALTGPGQGDLALLLGGATLLGWLGAMLSLRQHLMGSNAS